MSGPTTSSLNQLPLEILHAIFHYLDIPDILRLRRVSQYLNQVSHGRDVWSDAYRRAEFVRAPGPFLSQSARELENALVPSFRVDRNLRSGGDAAQKQRSTLKLREIRYTGVDLRVDLVFGRFLFIAFCQEVRCYDLDLDVFDSNSGASIIYRPTDGVLKSFHCVSAVDMQGRPFACAVMSEETQTTTQILIYSVNIGEDSEVTLDPLHQFEHPLLEIHGIDLGPRVIVVRCRIFTPNGSWHWHLVVLDIHTRTQFMLPSYIHTTWVATTQMLEQAIEGLTSHASISTATHLLLAGSFFTQSNGWFTLIQAFALPPQHTHRRFTHTSILLSPSHRGSIPGINMRHTVLLQDTVLDPTTQDTLIAVQAHAYEPSRPCTSISKHGILRLSSLCTSYDHNSAVGTITFQPLGSFGHPSQMLSLHPSFNGTGRVFYTHEPGWWTVSALEYDLHANGSKGEREDKITEYPSILWFSTPRTLLDYDPYSGRICFRSAMAKYSVIEILDLAV